MIIHQTLSVLEDIVESVSGESTKSRQICYQSLQESVQVSLALFPAYIHQSGRSWPQAAQGPKSLLSSVEHPQSAVEALTLKAEGSEVYVGVWGSGPRERLHGPCTCVRWH